MADFIAEFSDDTVAEVALPAPRIKGKEVVPEEPNTLEIKASPPTYKVVLTKEQNSNPAWSLHIDGSSNMNEASVGIVFKSSEWVVLELVVRLRFEASDNESEYEVLILGLKRARALGIRNLIINCDFQLVANMLIGEYCARNQRMEAYMKLAQQLLKAFPMINNIHTNSLPILASILDSQFKRTIDVEYLPRPNIGAEHT